MAEKITAELRTEFGKGAARRIRRADKVPAVLYGHGGAPTHLTLPGHDTMLALKHGGANALLELEVDGKTQLALTKQVQSDPIKGFLEHIDFVEVKRGEKVTVEVPVVVVGEAAAETLVTVDSATLTLEVEATAIPESIEVSVEGAEAGTQVLAAGVILPEGATMGTDPEALVVNVTHAPTAAEVEAELAEAEAEAGIEREESDDAAEGDAGGSDDAADEAEEPGDSE